MKYLSLSTALCLALAACGGPDDSKPVPPNPELPVAPEKPPKTERTVTANEAAKKAALDRLEVMKKITVVLKPLREPDAALAKEAELKELFGEYNRLGQAAADEGIGGRLLAALTAHLAPDDWRDARTEFQQYMLLVRQLGDPQREMMDRVMAEGRAETEGASPVEEVEKHLEQLDRSADSPATRPGAAPASDQPAE